MKHSDPKAQEMLSRIANGELTRQQASDEYGVSRPVINVWIHRAGLAKKRPPPTTTFSARGPIPGKEEMFPAMTQAKADALNAAVDRVLRGEVSARAAALEEPHLGLSFVTIAAKVRKIRISQGLPVQVRSKRKPERPAYQVELEQYMQTKYGSQT